MVVALLGTVAFTACEEEVTTEQPQGATYVKAEEYYNTIVSEDILYFYDIVATTGVGGIVCNTIEVGVENWVCDYVRSGELPESVFCKVVATVKNPLPEIDPEKLYTFKAIGSASLKLYDNKGKKTLPMWDNGSSALSKNFSFKGVDKVTKFLQESHSELLILDATYTIR